MNLEKSICDRLFQSIDESNSNTKAELLKSCKLQMIVVESSSALSIGCPNSWTAKRVCEFLIGNLDRILHSLGIERAALNNGEGFIGYYQWDLTNMVFKGYFVNGDLNNLEIVPIPSDEDLGIF